MATGTLIFSHIIPVVLGFFGILFLISGIMEEEKSVTLLGIGLFLLAAFSPFLILSIIL